jgi:hypothetical protein
MKITFCVLFLLLAASAFGQVIGPVSNQAQMLQIPDHTLHAEPHALATERSLIGSEISYAQGERPLWDLAPAPALPSLTPLGDVARAFRRDKEKLAVRKAEIIFEKQGS